jgi:hypothetical protein
MTSQRFPTLLAILGLLSLGAAWAQESTPKQPQKKPQPDLAGLERRLADLDDRLAKLTKEVQDLRAALQAAPAKPRPGDKTTVNMFTLKHTRAPNIARLLHELFPEKDGTTLRFGTEPTSNTLVVRGSPAELDMVEALVSKLEDIAQAREGKQPPAK